MRSSGFPGNTIFEDGRVFADGEVRGHYEYTPECAPLSHMKKIGMEDRRHEFLALMSDRIISDHDHFSFGN